MSIHRLRRRSHNIGSGLLPYRGLTCVVLAALACAAPGVARAHGGGQYVAGPAATPPTVDGVVGVSEWASAHTLHRSVRIARERNDSVSVYADPPLRRWRRRRLPAGAHAVARRLLRQRPRRHQGHSATTSGLRAGVGTGDYLSTARRGSTGPSHYNDSVGAARRPRSATNNSGNIVFELRHPLCSADRAHDVCTSLGQTLGIDFQYDRSTPGVFANSPGPDLFDPSNNWADLILAANDVTPPTVSVTAPTAGSVLRGTVSVTANASDNVGVESVDFRYLGGGLPFVVLGTDTESRRIPRRSTPPRSRTPQCSTPGPSKPSPATQPATRGRWATRSRRQHDTEPDRVRERSHRELRDLRRWGPTGPVSCG